MFNTLSPYSHQPPLFPCYKSSVSSPLSSSPLRALPLSPRNANTTGPALFLSMSSPTPSGKQTETPLSKRPIKKNPLIHRSDDGRETRRKLFLRKVRENSEDRRWEARGGDDEMMRTIWIAEQRRRTERQAMEAEFAPPSQEEEFDDDHGEEPTSSAKYNDDDMVDEVAQMENAEMEALLGMIEIASPQKPHGQHEEVDTPYGSDDEEYDHLFMDVIEGKAEVIVRHDGITEIAEDADQDIMDTS